MSSVHSLEKFFASVHISENENVPLNEYLLPDYTLFIKREDRIHPKISGNKFRKLKYVVKDALASGKSTLITFGGAYSNHIAAVAALGKMAGLKTKGIIRGEELVFEVDANPTLSFARECGMQLHFISRLDYRDKMNLEVLATQVGDLDGCYIIPEGGTTSLAITGCEEILQPTDRDFDYVCVSVGTGGTLSGILNSIAPHQLALGFSALKGTFQKETIAKFSDRNDYELTDTYCFGGYAKIDSELIRFMNSFKRNSGILLDPVYTGKMMYGIIDLMKRGYFRKNSRILAIHTGGLQGIEGMNLVLKKKNLPQILH